MPTGVYVRTEETKGKMSNFHKGLKHSEETCKKISEVRKGKTYAEIYGDKAEEICRKLSEFHRGKSSGMLGKHHSEEVKQRMSKSHIGMYPTKETCKKVSESLKGHDVSEETRQKISAANMGHPKNIGMTGKHLTEESRKKMSAVRLGRRFTEEHRQHISEALRGRPPSSKPHKVFYNNIWFRSGWEAKYAKYLDEKDIEWEYEPHTFLLEVEGRETSYTPDFYLPELNTYHEVKGWRPKQNNIEKVFIARDKYRLNLVVVNKDLLKNLGIL